MGKPAPRSCIVTGTMSDRFTTSPPAEWPLDPDVTYLNHGGYGVDAQRGAGGAARMARPHRAQPDRFLARELPRRCARRRREVAAALGAGGEDLVFVENATAGINAVLRSLDLAPATRS